MRDGLTRILPFAGLALLAAGCAAPPVAPEFRAAEEPEIAAAVDREANLAAFAFCRGYGCGLRDLVGLDDARQRGLRALFDPAPADAAAERAAVARAVALLEEAAGRVLGTWADQPRTPMRLGDPTQLDCVDESINTSTALHLFQRQGWLKWHEPAHPARRYAFLGFGVHFTAVLVERANGRAWAVDSWFHANGVSAEVAELERWRAGWQPEKAKLTNSP